MAPTNIWGYVHRCHITDEYMEQRAAAPSQTCADEYMGPRGRAPGWWLIDEYNPNIWKKLSLPVLAASPDGELPKQAQYNIFLQVQHKFMTNETKTSSQYHTHKCLTIHNSSRQLKRQLKLKLRRHVVATVFAAGSSRRVQDDVDEVVSRRVVLLWSQALKDI
jgi:hypothetical protein